MSPFRQELVALVLFFSLLCSDSVLGEPHYGVDALRGRGRGRSLDEVDHCTAIGIGRKATASGATMIAHTDDRSVRLGTVGAMCVGLLLLLIVTGEGHQP